MPWADMDPFVFWTCIGLPAVGAYFVLGAAAIEWWTRRR